MAAADPLRLQKALDLALKHLSEAGVQCALVGGLAVSVRAEERFTRDVDLAVAVSGDAEAEKVGQFMLRAGYQVAGDIEQTATERFATLRLFHPEQKRVLIDLLFASSGIEREIVCDAEPLLVLERNVRVATVGHLIATKTLSRNDDTRPQDRVDLGALIKVANENEIEEAFEALRLIEERGFNRARDLIEDLHSAIGEFGQD